MMQLISYAFLIGFVGSFHCVGMCGAIALSLPVKSLPIHQRNIGLILYNIGRVVTYSFIGVMFGIIGRTFYLGGFQKIVSVIIGIFIIVYLILTYLLKKAVQIKFIDKFNYKVQFVLSKYLSEQQLKNTFIIGLLNGLLPCGMVYFALAGALASGSILKGIVFMVMFGLGTIPLMLLVSYLGIFINISIRNTIKKVVPYFMLIMGVLFILRGLDLNIPYVSPMIESSINKVIPCH
jgi:sulfite exporter TauE/SafE